MKTLRVFALPCPALARWIVLAFASWLVAAGARAQDAGPGNTELVTRYEQILVRAPQAGPSFDRLVQLYGRGEGLDRLDERWTKLAAESGDNGAPYLVLRGLLADQLGRADDARQRLAAATAARPDSFYGWLALGDSAVHAGRWADGIAAFQKGLATKVAGEDRLTLFRKLGQAQQGNLDAAGALATWKQMAAEFPDDRFAVEEAATALLDADRFEDARSTFQKLADLAEPDSMARVQALR
jgi:tetratricopeptide (TPR) repeat protein